MWFSSAFRLSTCLSWPATVFLLLRVSELRSPVVSCWVVSFSCCCLGESSRVSAGEGGEPNLLRSSFHLLEHGWVAKEWPYQIRRRRKTSSSYFFQKKLKKTHTHTPPKTSCQAPSARLLARTLNQNKFSFFSFLFSKRNMFFSFSLYMHLMIFRGSDPPQRFG